MREKFITVEELVDGFCTSDENRKLLAQAVYESNARLRRKIKRLEDALDEIRNCKVIVLDTPVGGRDRFILERRVTTILETLTDEHI